MERQHVDRLTFYLKNKKHIVNKTTMTSCKTVREILNLLRLLVRKYITLLTKYLNIIGRIVTEGNGKLN